MKQKVIHFICVGNTYRGRLAAAYARSQADKNVRVISSGVWATRDLHGPITMYAKDVLEENNLQQYSEKTWRQTSQDLIDQSDLIIFMSPDVLEWADRSYNLSGKETVTWNVPDMPEYLESKGRDLQNEHARMVGARETYRLIQKQVGKLLNSLRKPPR